MLPLIELNDIIKTYVRGDITNTVLKNINVTISTSELVAIIGASGSGKSSLMNIIGLLDKPSSGEYRLNGQDMINMSAKQMAFIRNRQIGFIFQAYFMLPKLSILQNVGLPLTYREMTDKLINEEAHHALMRVGIDHLSHRYPRELSGGQMQRAAIARALVGNPTVILADEPTGALDSKVSQEIMDLFIQLNQIDKNTIIVITHDQKIAQQCPRNIKIHDGLITAEKGDL